jgi:uncharacterized protein YkwD
MNYSYESEVITLVNGERSANGLPALSFNASLTAGAEAWSVYMATSGYWGHSSDPVWENIAAGYSTPASVVVGWMASPGHRANILNASLTQVGAGYAYCASSAYGHYWTLQLTP